MPPKQLKLSAGEMLREVSSSLRESARKNDARRYDPTKFPKQTRFLSSVHPKRQYIGGNRSGKTVGGVLEGLWYASGEHPLKQIPWRQPTRGRVVAVDFKQGVQKILHPIYKSWCPNHWLRGGNWDDAYNNDLNTLYFANGSEIEFMSYEQDLQKFAGVSRHWIHFDEEPPKAIFTENMMRLIDTDGHYWITMTPVDGMTWTYDDIFEDEDVQSIIVDMTENPYLNPKAIEGFLKSLSPDDRKARQKGLYVAVGGLIYPQFTPEVHVIRPFNPPKNWLWVASMDHGITNPTSWHWTAIDTEGRKFVFDEYYVTDLTVKEHAEAVREINASHGRQPDYNVGDPSIRNKDPITGTSVHTEYAINGLPIVLGNNDVRAGIDLVRKHLNDKKIFVTENCVNLIKEFKKYRWAEWRDRKAIYEKNKKDEPQKKDDHALDDIRYMVSSRPELDTGDVTPYRHRPDESSIAIDPNKPWIDNSNEYSEVYVDYHLGSEV